MLLKCLLKSINTACPADGTFPDSLTKPLFFSIGKSGNGNLHLGRLEWGARLVVLERGEVVSLGWCGEQQ